MYIPERFAQGELTLQLEVMRENPFATVVTSSGGEPFVSQLPLLVEPTTGGRVLITGHMSIHNPQWKHIEAGATMVVSFQGPHAYINANWYFENDVPTWNYVTVQAKGQGKLVQDYKGLLALLRKAAEQAKPWDPDPWEFFVPEDLRGESLLTRAIVGFELETSEISGKFKLGQHRSSADQVGVLEGLRRREDASSRRLADWTERLMKQKNSGAENE